MDICFSSSLVSELGIGDPNGFRLDCKTPKKHFGVEVSKEDEPPYSPGVHRFDTPTGGKHWTWKLPLGITVRISNENRVSHLVGFPSNVDTDYLLSNLYETFRYIAVGALRYQSEYSMTNEDDWRDEYTAIIDDLTGKNDATYELSDAEQKHQDEEYDKMFDDPPFLYFCHCDVCENISEQRNKVERENRDREGRALERFMKVLPRLWD